MSSSLVVELTDIFKTQALGPMASPALVACDAEVEKALSD